MRRDDPTGEAGFTLVEVLVAATILVVGLLATLALVDRASSSTASSKQRDVGNALAQEMLERAQGGRYTTSRNDLTDVDTTATLKGPADRLRAALDPDGDSASTAISPATPTSGVPLSSAQTWTLKRRNTTYTVSYRACTSSDVYQQVQIAGPFDCSRPSTDPGGSDQSTNGSCVLGLNAPTTSNNTVNVTFQVLGVSGMSACIGSQILATNVCNLLGHSTLLNSVKGALLGSSSLLPQLLGGIATLGATTCDPTQVEQGLAGATDGIASATRVTVTVAWTDTDRRAQSITQTAIVRRPAP